MINRPDSMVTYCRDFLYYNFERMFKMKRKKILSLVLATLLCCTLLFGGCSSKKEESTDSNSAAEKVYKVGITQIADHPSLDNCREGFIEGLKQEGFVEGENLEIDFKSAQNDMTLAEQIAQTFASSGKDLVCGVATPSAQTLYAACLERNIPVVFNAVSDPVIAKLAKSETEPQKGISGVSDRLPVKEQLMLIRELLPEAKKIGILYTTSEDNSVSTIETYKALAGEFGFEIVTKGIGTEAEISQAIDALLPEVDCISNMTDNTVVNNLALLLQKAGEKNIPVFGSEEEQVKNGCIACAGLDYFKLGIQAGVMAAKVLNGTDISTLPFETIKESKITINETVAAKYAVPTDGDLAKTAETVK